MELQEFCRDRERMCSKNTAYNCPFVQNKDFSIGCNSCDYFCIHKPTEAEQIVSKWSKEHPIVTNGQKFNEMLYKTFPKDIDISFNHTVGSAGKCRITLNEKWWNAEYKESEVDNNAD